MDPLIAATESFLKVALRVCNKYSELKVVDKTDLMRFQLEWEEIENVLNANLFIARSLIGCLVVIAAPFAVAMGLEWASYNSLWIQTVLLNGSLHRAGSIAKFSIILFLALNTWLVMSSIARKEQCHIFKTRQSTYYALILASVYTFFAIVVFSWLPLASARAIQFTLSILLFGIYMFALFIIVALSAAACAYLIWFKDFYSGALFAKAPQAWIARQLLDILDSLSEVSSINELSSSKRAALDLCLRNVSRDINSLYGNRCLLIRENIWAEMRMKRVSENIQVMTSWIAFPRIDTISAVKHRIAITMLAFLSGAYDDLPDAELSQDQAFIRPAKESRRQRVRPMIAFLAYALSPLISYSVFLFNWPSVLSSDLKSILVLGYSIWILALIASQFSQLPAETRKTMMDAAMLIFKRT